MEPGENHRPPVYSPYQPLVEQPSYPVEGTRQLATATPNAQQPSNAQTVYLGPQPTAAVNPQQMTPGTIQQLPYLV